MASYAVATASLGIRGKAPPTSSRRGSWTSAETTAANSAAVSPTQMCIRDRATAYVSGGRRGFDISLAPADLARLTAATYAPIAR